MGGEAFAVEAAVANFLAGSLTSPLTLSGSSTHWPFHLFGSSTHSASTLWPLLYSLVLHCSSGVDTYG